MTMTKQLQTIINQAWEARSDLGTDTKGEIRGAADTALTGLDNGSLRVAQQGSGGTWTVNQWLKKARPS